MLCKYNTYSQYDTLVKTRQALSLICVPYLAPECFRHFVIERYSRINPPRAVKSTPRYIITMSKTALITGATGLLGRQVVTVFERREWRVVGAGFTRAKPPAVLKLDLGSEADIARAIDEVK
jgi:nicotinamide mononucleotide adenylyltransferase